MPNIFGEVQEFSNVAVEPMQNETKSNQGGLGAKSVGPSNENIRVFLRMRPFNKSETDSGESQNAARKWILQNQKTSIQLQGTISQKMPGTNMKSPSPMRASTLRTSTNSIKTKSQQE